MRIGLLEIAIIFAVIVVVALVAGVRRGGQALKTGKATSPVRQKVKLVGAIMFLVGLLLLSAAVSMFRYFIWSYMWASILLVIGITLYLFARRR